MSGLIATYEWGHLPWRKLEVAVFKLQKRIYKASQAGDTHNLVAVHRHCHDQIYGGYQELSQRLGTHDKSPSTEEPCAAKVASTVCAVRRVITFPV